MTLLVVCMVLIVAACVILNANERIKKNFCFLIGGFLIGLHLLVLLNNYSNSKQVEFFSNVSTTSAFFWDLFGFLGYNFVLIVGIIFIIIGNKYKNKIINDDAEILKTAEKQGMTPFDYIRDEVPQEVLEQCEEVRGDENLLKFVLKEYEKKGLVRRAHADVLFQEYMKIDKPENILTIEDSEKSK